MPDNTSNQDREALGKRLREAGRDAPPGALHLGAKPENGELSQADEAVEKAAAGWSGKRDDGGSSDERGGR